MSESRATKRRDMSTATHLFLLDEDADDAEDATSEIKAQFRKLMWIAAGAIISTSTMVLMLALNLTVNR